MEQFKIREGGFKELKWKIIFRLVPMAVIAVAGGLYMSLGNSANQEDEVNVLPIILPVLLIVLGVSSYIGIRRQKVIFDSYVLSVTDNMIAREQHNVPTISLYFNEIVEIVKQENGIITIKGKDPEDIIGIPAQIDGYSRLEVLLKNIQPFASPKKLPVWQRYPAILALVTVLLMAGVFVSNDKMIVLLTGIPLVGLISWSFKATQTSKNVDDRTKKMSRWALLVLAAIIANIIMKLMGWGH